MKRPEQHEIDTTAKRLFQSVLPPNLVVREPGDDYGIDAEVELFKDGQSTGAIFKVQLKGTRSPNYSADGKYISFNLELNRAEYLIEQIEIPTAIMLCDTSKGSVFWNVIHVDKSLRNAYELAKAQAQGTITVHFETCNNLPNTLPQMLVTLNKAGDILALDRAANMNLQTYSEKDSELLRQKIKLALENLSNIQQSIHELARKEGRWRVVKYIPIDELVSIAVHMLKSNEIIEALVAGSYTIENPFGNNEIVTGILALTSHRVIAILNAPMQRNGIRKEYFTYAQINTASMASDKNSISLITLYEVITLYDLSDVDPYQDPEEFYKYLLEKKTPPPKMTITARDVEIFTPPKNN